MYLEEVLSFNNDESQTLNKDFYLSNFKNIIIKRLSCYKVSVYSPEIRNQSTFCLLKSFGAKSLFFGE